MVKFTFQIVIYCGTIKRQFQDICSNKASVSTFRHDFTKTSFAILHTFRRQMLVGIQSKESPKYLL
jgi:hypothetical protein